MLRSLYVSDLLDVLPFSSKLDQPSPIPTGIVENLRWPPKLFYRAGNQLGTKEDLVVGQSMRMECVVGHV